MTQPFERVHTVTDYYDGPRVGIADYLGQPHVYRSVYLDSTDWNPDEDRFELSPIEPEVFQLALEDWAIWRRWNEAFHAGLVDHTTHPALPEDRARHDHLMRSLHDRLRSDPALRLLAHGEFRVREPGTEMRPGTFRTLEVRWTPAASKTADER